MNASLEPENILTPDELASRLKVSKRWIYECTRKRGRFGGPPMPVLKCGQYLRFDWEAVVQWLRDGSADPSQKSSTVDAN